MVDIEIETLKSDLNALKKHIAEQDAEIYRLSLRVDGLQDLIKRQKDELAALREGSASADTMPIVLQPGTVDSSMLR